MIQYDKRPVLIARTLSDFKNNDSVLAFASGVSNSGEGRKEEYKRKKDLLFYVIHTHARMIFSALAVCLIKVWLKVAI